MTAEGGSAPAPPAPTRRLRGLAAWAGLLLLACACSPRPAGMVTVSGKTAYRGMGVEGVRVRAHTDGGPAAQTRSGYHGSFHLRLAPGSYRLVGEGTLPAGAGRRRLRGETHIRVGPGRLDRVVIELSEAPRPRPAPGRPSPDGHP